MKRTLLCALGAALLLSVPARGARSVPVQLDGAALNATCYVENGTTYVPLRALLDAMGVGGLGEYEVSSFASGEDTVLRIRFAEELDDTEELWMGNTAYLLLALTADADRVDYAFPTDGGSRTTTFYCDGAPLDSWAKKLGYRDVKSLGSSAQGIRALLEYLGWEKAAALSLDALAGQDVLPAFLELLTSGACGTVCSNLELVHVQFEIRFLCLRKHCYRDG